MSSVGYLFAQISIRERPFSHRIAEIVDPVDVDVVRLVELDVEPQLIADLERQLVWVHRPQIDPTFAIRFDDVRLKTGIQRICSRRRLRFCRILSCRANEAKEPEQHESAAPPIKAATCQRGMDTFTGTGGVAGAAKHLPQRRGKIGGRAVAILGFLRHGLLANCLELRRHGSAVLPNGRRLFLQDFTLQDETSRLL